MHSVLALLGALATAYSATVENSIIGEPEIECHSDQVLVNFNTQNAFEGHVYVKGHYGTAGCRTDATNSRAATIAVPFAACGVRRQRSLNPNGLFVIATVVVSFHPQFLTMVDRAYHVKCFYMETDKTVTSELGVSMITTQNTLTQSIPMPTCRYQVLRGDENGPAVKFAQIGEQVYHFWSCDTETSDIFCMTVHSCFVDNGQGTQVQLLDENGCAQDKFLLENVNYQSDLSGGQGTMVFKFADKPTLFFNCQIRLTLKADGKCERTSDNCDTPIRGRRAAVMLEKRMPRNESAEPSVDVFSEEITILSDINTPDAGSADSSFNRGLPIEPMDSPYGSMSSYPYRKDGGLCVSQGVLYTLVIGFSLAIIIPTAAVAVFCMRRRDGRMSAKQ